MSSFQVKSEISGTILTVEVSVGQSLGAGAEPITLEAMKMEIPVALNEAGRVTEVRVKVGDVVEEGNVLLVMERA